MNNNTIHTQVNVTRNCLLEFLDLLDQSSCHDICITYSDYGWHVQYESPFTHDPEVKKDFCSPQQIAEADCCGDPNKCGGNCNG